MKITQNKSTHIFSQFCKIITLVTTVTFIVYGFSQYIGLSILKKNLFLNLDEKLAHQLFSSQMIPTMIVYAALITTIFILYNKAKKIISIIHENEIRIEREKAVVQTSQRITGMMSEYISVYNADIKEWIEERKERGQQPPSKIVNANMKISMALNALTEASFLLPYAEINSVEIDDYTRHIENKLV